MADLLYLLRRWVGRTLVKVGLGPRGPWLNIIGGQTLVEYYLKVDIISMELTHKLGSISGSERLKDVNVEGNNNVKKTSVMSQCLKLLCLLSD